MRGTLRFLRTMTIVVIALISMTFAIACSGSKSNNSNSGTVTITISPDVERVEAGRPVTLTVRTQNTEIAWPEAVEGSYTKNGAQAIWTLPETRGEYEFTVTATADPSKKATAKVTVFYAEPTIRINPETATVRQGNQFQFEAQTTVPIGQPNQTVQWDVSDDCGTVDQAGLFTAARKSGACQVTASLSDIDDREITAEAEIAVFADPSIVIAPMTAIIVVGNTQQFNATITTPAGEDVQSAQWMLSDDCGTISQTGFFTAVKTGICEVTGFVTGHGDESIAAKATVTVKDSAQDPTIAIAPTTATLVWGETRQFVAAVAIPSGQPSQSAQWEVYGDCGTVDQTGLFSAAQVGDCAVTASVIGTSGQKITATAAVTVSANPSVAISPTSATAVRGETVQFSAKVVIPQGQPNQTASWEISAGDCGTVDQSGLFMAVKAGNCEVSAYVTSTSGGKIMARASVTVKEQEKDPEITIIPTTRTVNQGRTFQFSAKVVVPQGQPEQTPTWEVSGDCGTVDQSGLFAAVKTGTCEVTAFVTGGGGQKIAATATVTVPEAFTIDMVFVEGGTFDMGCSGESECSNNEGPVHPVTLSAFYIGKYEVTQAEWKSIMGDDNNPSSTKGNHHPVTVVSWVDIQTFIEKLNAKTGRAYRLPTEAEWEYAAEGGSKSQHYKYSGSNDVDAVAWYAAISGNYSTHVIGMKAPNELGLYDMSGNAWEVVEDWYGEYGREAQVNPTGPTTGVMRTIRGGSVDTIARMVRVSTRSGMGIDAGMRVGGFRLAHDAE